MSFDNDKVLSPEATEHFLIALQIHLIHLDLLTNTNFQQRFNLSPKKTFDQMCHLNSKFYKEYEHLFLMSKDQMQEIVNERFNIKVPQTNKTSYGYMKKKKLF